jgi:hypothetical protein
MTKQAILEGLDEDAVKFDVDDFLSQLFNTIESFRSQMSLQENQVVEYPVDNGGSKNSESKVNAFYRLLGFPAARGDVANLPQNLKENKDALSQHKTLNYFSNISADTIKKVTDRENALYQKIDFQKAVDMIRDPLPFTAALEGSSRRPSIFPLVVHAAVPVFPTNRRTAPLFFDGDYILLGDQKRLTRPFIEHIVYMRTKVFAGFDAYSDALKNQINKELAETEFKDDVLKDIDKSEFLSLKIANKLLRALKQCAEQYRKAQENLERLRKDVQFVPAPKDNPAERAGNLPDSVSSTLQIDEISEKGLEKQISAIKAKMASEDIFIKLLPSEYVKKSDRIKRIEDEVQNDTVADDVFISEFNHITTYEKFEYNKQLKDLEDQRARFIAKYESVRRDIMYLNGESTGLSIFDVLCILLALFTVDLGSLLAIVNEDSLNSLKTSDLYYKANPGQSTPAESIQVFTDISNDIAGAASVGVAAGLQAIQEKVKENFKVAEAFYKKALKSGGNRD